MPLYDYRCRACGHTFEALVRNDIAPTECEKCHAADLERLPSVFAASSSEKRQASADAKRHKAAAIGRQETMAEQREIEHHRKEDH